MVVHRNVGGTRRTSGTLERGLEGEALQRAIFLLFLFASEAGKRNKAKEAVLGALRPPHPRWQVCQRYLVILSLHLLHKRRRRLSFPRRQRQPDRKRAALGSWLATSTVPPCSSTISLTTNSPMPMPLICCNWRWARGRSAVNSCGSAAGGDADALVAHDVHSAVMSPGARPVPPPCRRAGCT